MIIVYTHIKILFIFSQYAQLSEIAYQVDAAIDEFHAVHVVENGRRKRENIVARDTIYKIGIEQRAFFVADDDRDIGKGNRGLDGQNAVSVVYCGQNGRGLVLSAL